MKVKLNKSLIVFLVAIIALFFFMSSRSNADGAKDGENGGGCGYINKKIVRCKKSFCSVEPKKDGKEGKCGPKTTWWKKDKK